MKRRVQKTEIINELRFENGLLPLVIVEIQLVLADDNKPISSTRIRRGEIDDHGNLKGMEGKIS